MEKEKNADIVNIGEDYCVNMNFQSTIENIDAAEGSVLELTNDDKSMVYPTMPNGWVPVDYDRRTSIKYMELSNVETSCISSNSDDEIHFTNYESCSGPDFFPVYRHKIPSSYCQQQDDKSGKYWEAFDIPFNPSWKEIVATKLGGLTDATIAIVRLISNLKEASVSYCTIYMKNTSISSYIEGEISKYKKELAEAQRTGNPAFTRKKIADFAISYPESCLSDAQYGYFVSALAYASYINKGAACNVVEQIMDYRHGGKTGLLLSDQSPKTEIRKEYNVFKGVPPYIVTNYWPSLFISRFSHGNYEIKKFIRRGAGFMD